MAQKTTVTHLDDTDPTGQTPADVLVELNAFGTMYELDLSDDNYARLQKSLADYIAAARKVGGRWRRPQRYTPENGQAAPAPKAPALPPPPSVAKAAKTDPPRKLTREESREIRNEWAPSNPGWNVPRVGRIPNAAIAAYLADQAKAASNGKATRAPVPSPFSS